MAQRTHPAALRILADIREAQAKEAVARAMQAAKGAAAAQEQLVEAQARQAERGETWLAIVGAGRLDLTLVQAWGRAVVEGEAALAATAVGARNADARRAAAAREAQTA